MAVERDGVGQRTARVTGPTASAVPVVRDTTFHRAVADDFALLSLGRDLELAFLQFGGVLQSIDEKQDHFVVVGDDAITEVVRVRLDFPVALKLAMQVVQHGIELNRVKADGLIESVKDWSREAEAKRRTDASE